MKATYGPLDLFALAAKLLAPFVDPLRAEFARRGAIVRTAQTAPPAVEVVTVTTAPLTEPTTPAADQPPVASPEAEVLYVPRGTGRGRRYDVAQPGVSGDRFRKLLKGRKTVYELVK